MNQKTAELEKNELADWVEKKLGGWKQYSNLILLGVLALILVSMLLAFWWAQMIGAKSEPWREFQAAKVQNMSDRQASHFQLVADNHPDTLAGMWALQYAGDNELMAGLPKLITDRKDAIKQIERGIKYYEEIQKSTARVPDMLKERSMFSLAYAYESVGRFEDAKKEYERLLETMPNTGLARATKEGITRVTDPVIVTAFEKFAAVGTAPGMTLPAIPDISFPGISESDQ